MDGIRILKILLTIVSFLPNIVDCGLIQRSKHQFHAFEGDNVTMNCTTTGDTSVAWEYMSFQSITPVFLYYNGEVLPSHRHRFSVHVDHRRTHFHLTLRHALHSDSGTYSCVDAGGLGPDRLLTILNVTKKLPGDNVTTRNITETTANPTSVADQNLPFIIVLVSLIGVLLLPVFIAGIIFRNKLGCRSRKHESEPTTPQNRVDPENPQSSLISSSKAGSPTDPKNQRISLITPQKTENPKA